jgi:glutathione S-transferase
MVTQIPAITYGGPKVKPDHPSPESVKLNESLVILEFLADIFPSSGLLPADPVQRAKARLFINVFETKVFEGFKGFFFMGAPASQLLDALDALQNALPGKDGFAVGGKWCIADMAAAPFLARIEMLLKHDLGTYPVGEGKKTFEALHAEKFARYRRYLEDLKAQPSFKATWDEVRLIDLAITWRQVSTVTDILPWTTGYPGCYLEQQPSFRP